MLQGITASAACKGQGTVRFSVVADDGTTRTLETKALYVPDAKVRLLSIQTYCHEMREKSQMVISGDSCYFNFPTSVGGGKITFDLKAQGNLPRTTASRQFSRTSTDSNGTALHSLFTVLDESNLNLSRAQKHILDWHWKLNHASIPWIQYLFRQNILPTNNISGVTTSNCKCQACQLGKQVRESEGVTKSTIRPEKDGNLKKNVLSVGSMVSSDQFVSSLKGRLPNTYGKENESEKFVGGTIYIDEASEYITVQNQVSLNAAETLRGKHRMERDALRHGISIRGYRCDNGIYKSQEFVDDTRALRQTIQYSGIGAHHHNGIAERCIRTISTSARTILLHAMIHWPDEVTLDLWPFAIDYAVYIWNKLPRAPSHLSPEEIYYSTKSNHEALRNAKVWGCPTYVLDPRLQDGKKLPRWEPRSKIGQFLGRSKVHAGSVGLIKNTATGKVSSQFHVVYDEHFTTLSVNQQPQLSDIPEQWKSLLIYNREQTFDPTDFDTLSPAPSSNLRTSIQPPSSVSEGACVRFSSPPAVSEGEPLNINDDSHLSPFPEVDSPAIPDISSDTSSSLPSTPLSSSSHSSDHSHLPSPLRPTHSKRISKPPDRFVPTGKGYFNTSFFSSDYLGYLTDFRELNAHDAFLVESDLNANSSPLTVTYDAMHLMKLDDDDPTIIHSQHPLAFSARANAADHPTLKEAMEGPDREGFLEAMYLEMDQLEGMEAWVVVPRSKALKENRNIFATTWAFRRKRFPDGSVKKLKARLCARGDQQIGGVDYFETYSPVVQWSTIRLMLVLSILLGLETMQVDYTLTFVQAPASPGTYIEMPKMFELDGMILELKRNLYGLCEAPRNFYNHLKKGLEDRGLSPSPHDHCLFMSSDIIVLTYVDDCIFFARNTKSIDSLINSLRKAPDKFKGKWDEFMLSKEEDYAGFLGIDISKSKHIEGAIELLQVGLIDRILAVLGLDKDNTHIRMEPASPTPIGKEEDSAPRKENWSYASVIGMLLYLSSNSRPDIAFAVHQAAKFSHCARLPHKIAIKRIGRYLKATRDKGLIMNPSENLILEFYADADFAGLWNVEDSNDPLSVKSRTGFIITLGGTPVTWSSKLQTEIATSTMHAEYIALSTGMRELIPVKNTLEHICEVFKISRDAKTQLIKVWEDNEGTLKLANSPLVKVTPQSKHFAIKYHWFREKLIDLKLSINYVRSAIQKADIFTKGLCRADFQAKRKLIMGW